MKKILAEIHHSDKHNDEYTLLRIVVDDETRYYTVVSTNGFDDKNNGAFAEIELTDEYAFLGESDFCFDENDINRKIVNTIKYLPDVERYHYTQDPSLN